MQSFFFFLLLSGFYSKKELRVDKDNAETQRKEIYQDLLIWALFANRQELATIFWVKCNNQLCKNFLFSLIYYIENDHLIKPETEMSFIYLTFFYIFLRSTNSLCIVFI